jgi:hypothetical protein
MFLWWKLKNNVGFSNRISAGSLGHQQELAPLAIIALSGWRSCHINSDFCFGFWKSPSNLLSDIYTLSERDKVSLRKFK